MEHTCFWESMLAKPPEWLDCPPFLPMFCTSSRGRLEKFPGLELSAIVIYWFESVLKDVDWFLVDWFVD